MTTTVPEQAAPARIAQPSDWWRVALTPKMLVLLVLLIVAAAACIRLGYWQFERATSRGAERIATQHVEQLNREVEPLLEVLPLQTTMTAEEYARPVSVSGQWGDGQVRVVGRSVDGVDVDLVLAEFTLAEGGVVPVIRGWVPVGDPLPPAPAGDVTVYGYTADPEEAVPGARDGRTQSISPAELVNMWGGPILSGYLVEYAADGSGQALSAPGSDDPAGLAAGAAAETERGFGYATPPRPTEEGGFNIQNAAYAIEWVVFAGFAVFIWVRQLGTEVRRTREDRLLEFYDED